MACCAVIVVLAGSRIRLVISRPRQKKGKLCKLHKDAEDEPSCHRADGYAEEDAEDGC